MSTFPVSAAIRRGCSGSMVAAIIEEDDGDNVRRSMESRASAWKWSSNTCWLRIWARSTRISFSHSSMRPCNRRAMSSPSSSPSLYDSWKPSCSSSAASDPSSSVMPLQYIPQSIHPPAC